MAKYDVARSRDSLLNNPRAYAPAASFHEDGKDRVKERITLTRQIQNILQPTTITTSDNALTRPWPVTNVSP